MFIKCLLLLFVLDQIDAQYGHDISCPYPRLDHGRLRIRGRSKLVKFFCFPGYELVGNKYATCRGSEWDVPNPVCVKPGCKVSPVENAVFMPSRNSAWVVYFCLPGHKMIGSSAIFCDGRKWNGTAPTCVDTTAPSSLSCDFQSPDMCGWTQDELHDFDWKRLNKRTPSSFLFTGPATDHTYGKSGSGYYIYIESTSQQENDTARIVSPIYDAALARDGCFSFYYHMFGKTTGGLRVYQKPENYPLQSMLQLSSHEKLKYLLFEKWGNQGDAWYRGISGLNDFSDNFQIVIEGVRGTSYTSDIAVDDVAILQGENCSVANTGPPTTPAVMPDSCSGRCDILGVPTGELGCECTASCISNSDCCPDFFDICLFDQSTTASDSPLPPVEMPQTQKLVASTTTTSTSSSSTTSTTTTTTTTPKPMTTPRTTLKTTSRPTIIKATTKTPATPTPTLAIVFKSTTAIYNATGIIKKDKTTKPIMRPVAAKTTKKIAVVTRTAPVKTTPVSYNDKMKASLEQSIEHKKTEANKLGGIPDETKSQSTGVRNSFITIGALLCCAGTVWFMVAARGARGRQAIARLRGRAQRDPEVRYLNADVDDD